MRVYETCFIDGAWVPSTATEAIDVVDPATEEVAARIPAGTPADVDRAVAAARAAFAAWSATSTEERIKTLDRIREGLEARAGEVAKAITTEMGAPLTFSSRIQVGLPMTVLGSVSSLLADYDFEERLGTSLVVREPVGVVGAITPWNYPLHQVVAKIAPALAAGCTVVLKPSEVAPLSAYLFMEILDEAGVPAGVVNLVPGTGPVVGEAMAAHPDIDMMSFTGSTAAGRRVSELASGTIKRVALELGGKSANVILPDADHERAVKAGVANCFINGGQTCTAHTRMIVSRQRYAETLDNVVAVASGYTVGSPLDEATRIGPLVSERQRDRVRGYITRGVEEGARLVTGGAEAPDGLDVGYYVRPTVFADVDPTMTIAREEIFGPVLSVIPYDDEDDALRIANDSTYGLAGAVWAGDDEHALAFAKKMRTGQVEVNGGRFNPLAPFGGYKQSGNGRELGRYGLEEFLEIKSLQL
jgi:acyl-CoA reductase-like NAD-dependent aldehyde dehydrogenase